MSSDQKDDEMICALTADEHEVLQRGLRELPETMPPRQVWQKIRAQAEAEGLFATASPRGHRKWYLGAGLAAAAVMAAVIMTSEPNPGGVVVPQGTPTNITDLSNLTVLQAQSQQIERELRALPEQPKVARASTVATMSEIEDRIAAIDYQLNDPAAQWADGEREIFWRERVRLMNLLLQLRYAQAQRAAY